MLVRAKTFNTAGPCDPRRNYMLPPEARLGQVEALIEQESYFVLHAPRQVGKTTSVRAMAERLTREGRFGALWLTCEKAQAAGNDVEGGIAAVLQDIDERGRALPEELRPPTLEEVEAVPPLSRLYVYLHRWAERSPRPLVLFFDEIDALIGNTLISVLRQLRSGFADRPSGFPQSVALIGLRDVRDYKLEAQRDAPTLGTTSPFNIKIESLTLRDFNQEEVAALCRQHQEATGQPLTPRALERIFELTQGQPWLVNALARQLVEVEVPDRSVTIEEGYVDQAKEKLILRRDTHLDSLSERLREPRVQRVLAPLLAGDFFGAEVGHDDLQFAVDLGLLRRNNGNLEIANPIYREIIPRSLSEVLEAELPISRPDFLTTDGRLSLEKLLGGFRAFWLENAESFLAKAPYSEAAAQLVFMAYLHKVVNGGGFIDREYAVGRGRIDICLRWPHPKGLQRFAIELKVRRDNGDVEAKGIEQLAAYLERLSLEEGTLIIFDARPGAPPPARQSQEKNVEHAGRRIRVLTL